jgi:hypothetical protein
MDKIVEDHFDKIEQAVRDTLKVQFDHIKILEVRVHKETDSDDDALLRIDVIFEGKPADLDAKKLASVGRNLQSRLNAMQESALPLLSFISGADWRRNRRATA